LSKTTQVSLTALGGGKPQGEARIIKLQQNLIPRCGGKPQAEIEW
jgi:hypothetical protein